MSARFWTLGIFFNIISIFLNFSDIIREEVENTKKFQQASNDQEKKEANEKRKTLAKKKFDNALNLAKCFGDSINATTGAKITDMLGFKFHESMNACGGLVSSTITMY